MTEGILFCTPCYGGMVTEPHFASCLKLKEALTEMKIPHGWYTLKNESAVHRARNNCVDFFLKNTDFSHLMFIDADIEFTPDDVGKLWAMDKALAVGVYRMKREGSQFVAWVNGALIDDLDQFSEPIRVDYAGTGFMMIRRDVFEKVKEATPNEVYETDEGTSHRYFVFSVEDGVELSEDYYFCERARESHVNVWMEPSVRLKHHGTCAYG